MALRRDNFDAFCSLLAGLVDGLAAFLGVMAAVWIRFDSGLIPLKHAELFPSDHQIGLHIHQYINIKHLLLVIQ